MSRDFTLAWPCPHLTIEEVVDLDRDRQSLFTRQPIGSVGTIRITANDNVILPQSGTYSQAVLYGSKSGPFDINETENVFIITISETARVLNTDSWDISKTDTIIIPPVSRRFSVKDMVAILNAGVNKSQVVISSENGHLVITNTTAVGPNATVRVGGSAAKLLGFEVQSVAKGRELYPGWGVYDLPSDVKIDSESISRYPRFNSPVKGNPIFKVTYSVPPDRCLRCRGSRVENDIRFDSQGQALMVKDEDLLYQAALKIMLTEKGSNPYHPWYGTQLKSRIGNKAVAGIASLISEDIRQALAKLQNLQEGQGKFQKVSYKERLYTILSVNVTPHVQDNTAYLISVTVQNASGEPVNITTIFTVPSVVALMGSNGLMLGGT